MFKRKLLNLALVATLAAGLAACNNPRAESAGTWWNPLSYGDQTLTQSLEKGCMGGARSTVIDGATYDCPNATDGNPSDGGSDLTAPEPGVCDADPDKPYWHSDNRSAPFETSIYGGSDENCWLFGEVNFKSPRKTTVLVVIPPGYTLNMGGHFGGTFWSRPNEDAVTWSIGNSTHNLTLCEKQADGTTKGRCEKNPIVVRVDNPADLKKFPANANIEVVTP